MAFDAHGFVDEVGQIYLQNGDDVKQRIQGGIAQLPLDQTTKHRMG